MYICLLDKIYTNRSNVTTQIEAQEQKNHKSKELEILFSKMYLCKEYIGFIWHSNKLIHTGMAAEIEGCGEATLLGVVDLGDEGGLVVDVSAAGVDAWIVGVLGVTSMLGATGA